ncbi:hypothetical protein PRIPAC_72228 [Pristionchus pacificus]|uniref:Uncharacterized protein n=1 Tax=Pristionchus pacificus TaxID=54126 RepID=A0A2A6C6W2_PRIPA|nr:hypothetical protein PRIPAC_72228 [Pristionchus pacificus]|eukprot:PDM73914.1 hypothetical protein PRIPAC_41270 [Pristionchus pacificus]
MANYYDITSTRTPRFAQTGVNGRGCRGSQMLLRGRRKRKTSVKLYLDPTVSPLLSARVNFSTAASIPSPTFHAHDESDPAVETASQLVRSCIGNIQFNATSSTLTFLPTPSPHPSDDVTVVVRSLDGYIVEGGINTACVDSLQGHLQY